MKPHSDDPAAASAATAATPSVETTKAPKPVKAELEGKVWLTTRSSQEFGGRGRFVTLTETEAAAAPEGLLVEPTAEQLAQRG